MQFEELLAHRKSTRSFTGEPVTRAELDAMLRAGTLAPNACNAQSWHFFCTLDREMINRLVPDIYSRGEWLRDVGCAILICTNPTQLEARFGSIARERYTVQDTAAAATQILQCATTLGLAGCWMGAFDFDRAREFFGVPAEMEPVILLGIGRATAEPPARPRKPMDEVVTMIGECTEEQLETQTKPAPYTLRGTVLPDAVFEDVNLKGLTVKNAKLAGARFDNVNLSKSSFNNINLSGTAFTDANMAKTSYGGLTMQGAEFGCVDLQDARFANPDLSRAVFEGCSLRDVQINNCDITGLTIDGISVAELIEAEKAKRK